MLGGGSVDRDRTREGEDGRQAVSICTRLIVRLRRVDARARERRRCEHSAQRGCPCSRWRVSSSAWLVISSDDFLSCLSRCCFAKLSDRAGCFIACRTHATTRRCQLQTTLMKAIVQLLGIKPSQNTWRSSEFCTRSIGYHPDYSRVCSVNGIDT
jgi:hypothetical protein